MICGTLLASINSNQEVCYDEVDKIVLSKTEELKQMLSDKQILLNNVSHEVKNPVMVAYNNIELLAETLTSINLSDLEKRLLYTTRLSMNKLYDYVSNLLDMSKIESGKMVLDIKNNNLFTLLEDVVKIYTNYTIEIYYDEHAAKEFEFDKFRIEQVLSNLLSNCAKYSAKEKIRIFVKEYSQKSLQDSICISIVDEGIGIPNDEMKMIFSPFTQSTRTKGSIKGTGIGLTLCKEIIKMHHGKIWAENNPTKGATFSFVLPTYLSTEESNHTSKLDGNLLKQKPLILLVDDDLQVLESVKMQLEYMGFNVQIENKGQEAIQLINTAPQKFYLVLLDMMLPDLEQGGNKVLIETKAVREKYNLPVIIQSGMDKNNKEITLAKQLGATAFLSKPYKSLELKNMVMHYIKQSIHPVINYIFFVTNIINFYNLQDISFLNH